MEDAMTEEQVYSESLRNFREITEHYEFVLKMHSEELERITATLKLGAFVLLSVFMVAASALVLACR